MMAALLGLIVLAYWVVYWVFLLGDYYLVLTGVATALRLLFPAVVLCNVICVMVSIWRIGKGRKRLALTALVLNALPLIVSAGIFAWLFFGLRM
ncbi:MAG: hypothetical protein JW955_25845 [Sedimentisphaerales bacterium]|nr:hypothetical protein [Sedimentisphaerales bacterium]